MQLPPFGSFKPLCRSVPSYPWCNLFFRQLAKFSPADLHAPTTDIAAFEDTAPVGINIECGIPRGKLDNIANMIACGLSIIFTLYLVARCSRRKAAVGRVELRAALIFYALTLPLQLISTGAFLRQGSTALVAITAVHAGVVAAFFWSLVGNAVVATQVVEDGTMSSLVPFYALSLVFFVVTTYVSLDTGFSWTSAFKPSNPPSDLKNIALFVLTSIWPAAAAALYFVMMAWVVLFILRETKPLLYYAGAAFLFVLSQLDYFLLSKIICRGAQAKVDGSFIATILETASIGVLFLAWRGITEDSWDDPYYP